MSQAGFNVWRSVGMSYLQYLDICSSTLRGLAKESVKKKYAPWNKIEFRQQAGSGQDRKAKMPKGISF